MLPSRTVPLRSPHHQSLRPGYLPLTRVTRVLGGEQLPYCLQYVVEIRHSDAGKWRGKPPEVSRQDNAFPESRKAFYFCPDSSRKESGTAIVRVRRDGSSRCGGTATRAGRRVWLEGRLTRQQARTSPRIRGQWRQPRLRVRPRKG